MPRFIWNLDKDKKIKTKEIREYNIVRDESDSLKAYHVEAYCFFHGGVRLFKGSRGECVAFIESMTESGNHEAE